MLFYDILKVWLICHGLLLIDGIYSLSACDENFITFLVDTRSVIDDKQGIIQFITNVIASGSSEHSAFSVVLYGEHIPIDQNIKILSLHETKHETHRGQLIKKVGDTLRRAIDHIDSGMAETYDFSKEKGIALLPAFKIATGQTQPALNKAKTRKLPSNRNGGSHEGQQVYIIFDYYNRLLSDTNYYDLCKLFQHLDTNDIINNDEAPYFMMGQQFDPKKAQNITCHGYKPQYIKFNSFFHFTPKFARDPAKMELIYDLTCPATITSKYYKGYIKVSNHVQYVDSKTIIKCSLYYFDHDNDKTVPPELDETKSYVLVRDFFYDDNTFKLYDYLTIPPNEFYTLCDRGCNEPVVKIIRITQPDKRIYGTNDKDPTNDYQILKLFVRLPSTPQEYIREADISGKAKKYLKPNYHPLKPHNLKPAPPKQHRGRGHSKHMDICCHFNHPCCHRKQQTPKLLPRPKYQQHPPPTHRRHLLDSNADTLIFDELSIKNGEMDELIKYNPILAYLTEQILLQRMHRINNIAAKLAHARQIATRLYRKYRKNRHSRKDVVFGAKLMAQEFIGSIAHAFHHVVHAVKHVAKKAVHVVKKAVKKTVKVAKKVAKKTAVVVKHVAKKAVNVAKKAVKTTMKIAKKVANNPIVKSAINKVKQRINRIKTAIKTAVEMVKNLIKGKVEYEMNKKLIDVTFKKEWTVERTKKVSKTIGSKKDGGFKIIIKGDGTLTLQFGFHFKVEVGLYFKFCWKILKSKIHIEFKLYGEWDVGAHFNAKFVGHLNILFQNILNFGKEKIFWIVIVPVVIRPYFIINAKMNMIPISVYGGIECRYAERIELGYRYCNSGCHSGLIKSRKVIAKGCKKKFGLGDEEDTRQCPVEELGFDLILNIKLGCSLYEIINLYLRMEFVAPFRITLPEMDPTGCNEPKDTDMCMSEYLKASFTISLTFNIYLGLLVDSKKIMGFMKAVLGGSKGGDAGSPKVEQKILGPIKILPKLSLGCIDLKGILKMLNDKYQPGCCHQPQQNQSTTSQPQVLTTTAEPQTTIPPKKQALPHPKQKNLPQPQQPQVQKNPHQQQQPQWIPQPQVERNPYQQQPQWMSQQQSMYGNRVIPYQPQYPYNWQARGPYNYARRQLQEEVGE